MKLTTQGIAYKLWLYKLYKEEKMRIRIKEREVILAKMRIKQFDRQKTYNKFVCKNNYIGYLGELVLHRYLVEQGVAHQWLPFIKTGTNSPDFVIKGKTIDLKCSSGGDLWLTPYSPHDIYILGQITADNDYLDIKGWLTRDLVSIFKDTHARKVIRGSRVAFVISNELLLPTYTLTGVFTSSTPVSHLNQSPRTNVLELKDTYNVSQEDTQSDTQ